VESKFSGLALKVVKDSFFEELFVGLLAGFDVSLAILKHAIKEPGQFVGSGVDCCRRAKTNLDASDERSNGGLLCMAL
jgi:hypothetical protein